MALMTVIYTSQFSVCVCVFVNMFFLALQEALIKSTSGAHSAWTTDLFSQSVSCTGMDF